MGKLLLFLCLTQDREGVLYQVESVRLKIIIGMSGKGGGNGAQSSCVRARAVDGDFRLLGPPRSGAEVLRSTVLPVNWLPLLDKGGKP